MRALDVEPSRWDITFYFECMRHAGRKEYGRAGGGNGVKVSAPDPDRTFEQEEYAAVSRMHVQRTGKAGGECFDGECADSSSLWQSHHFHGALAELEQLSTTSWNHERLHSNLRTR